MKISKVKQYETKKTSKMGKAVLFTATLACLIVAGAGSVFAQVYRNLTDTTFSGLYPIEATSVCGSAPPCETVSITEPTSPEAVVVTWGVTYSVSHTDEYLVGLSVNGSGCIPTSGSSLAFGNGGMTDYSVVPGSTTLDLTTAFQWVIQPTDENPVTGKKLLTSGSNSFTLCVGGANDSSDSITIRKNTLSARLN
jgi:hypothetical protein